MSKRLQVLIEPAEYEVLKEMARRRGVTLAEWVRQALRQALREQPAGDPDRKLAAIRAAAGCSFPTADIEGMLEEIERGYRGEGPA